MARNALTECFVTKFMGVNHVSRDDYNSGCPLVKPFIIVSSTGYILESFGPYFTNGKNNDLSTLTTLVKSESR